MPNDIPLGMILEGGKQSMAHEWADPYVLPWWNSIVDHEITRIDEFNTRVLIMHSGDIWLRSQSYTAQVGMYYCWNIYGLTVQQSKNGAYMLILQLKNPHGGNIHLASWRTETAAWYWHDMFTHTKGLKNRWGQDPELRPLGYDGDLWYV